VHQLVNTIFDIITITNISTIVSLVITRNNGDPHGSCFKFHTAALSTLCDVPSIAVFCTESVECFVGMVSKFFF